MECIDCIEVAARLHLFLDRELSAEEVSQVQQHLTSCPQCECRFYMDVRIKRLIHERCTIARAPAHLRQAVLLLARHVKSEPAVSLQEIEMELKADIEDYE